MWIIISSTIAKREHKKTSEIEQWCLPDIAFLYYIYMEEAESLEEVNKEIPEINKH